MHDQDNHDYYQNQSRQYQPEVGPERLKPRLEGPYVDRVNIISRAKERALKTPENPSENLIGFNTIARQPRAAVERDYVSDGMSYQRPTDQPNPQGELNLAEIRRRVEREVA